MVSTYKANMLPLSQTLKTANQALITAYNPFIKLLGESSIFIHQHCTHLTEYTASQWPLIKPQFITQPLQPYKTMAKWVTRQSFDLSLLINGCGNFFLLLCLRKDYCILYIKEMIGIYIVIIKSKFLISSGYNL